MTESTSSLSRRKALQVALAGTAAPLSTWTATDAMASPADGLALAGTAAQPSRANDWVLTTPQGTLMKQTTGAGKTRLELPAIRCVQTRLPPSRNPTSRL